MAEGRNRILDKFFKKNGHNLACHCGSFLCRFSLYSECNDVSLKGPNDIVFDKNGDFWFTDLGKVRDRNMDRGAIYWAKSDGSEIREVIQPFMTPNGIGLSPDEQTLYVAETEGGKLYSYKIINEGQVEKITFPESEFSNPQMILKRVDLPEPDGPSRATISPLPTSKLKLDKTSFS